MMFLDVSYKLYNGIARIYDQHHRSENSDEKLKLQNYHFFTTFNSQNQRNSECVTND